MSAKTRLKPLAGARASLTPLAAGLLLACLGGNAVAADLMQAYELARQSDPQLQAAEANSLVVGENVPQARSALLPQLSGSSYFRDFSSDGEGVDLIRNPDGSVQFGQTASGSDTRSTGYEVNLQQSIYNHANYTRLRASRARAERAQADYDLAADQLKLRTSEAYFNVLTAIDTLAFTRAERRAVKRQLDQAEQRFEVGLTAITDVHEARARYDSARANVIAAENALDDNRELLAEITGSYLTQLKGLSEGFEPTLPSPAAGDAWVDLAIKNSPSLRAGKLAVIAAGHDIATANAGHLPTLSAGVRYGDDRLWGNRSSSGGLTPADSDGHDTTVSISLNVPIFSGGLTRSQVRQAVYSRDVAEEQLEQQRRAVTRSTRNAYRAVESGISSIGARQQAVVSANSALEATQAGFEVGTRTIVDVLLSQQQLFQAQRDFSQARHLFVLNSLRLRQAAGTIEVKDLQEVNRLLQSDAEAKLATDPTDESAG